MIQKEYPNRPSKEGLRRYKHSRVSPSTESHGIPALKPNVLIPAMAVWLRGLPECLFGLSQTYRTWAAIR